MLVASAASAAATLKMSLSCAQGVQVRAQDGPFPVSARNEFAQNWASSAEQKPNWAAAFNWCSTENSCLQLFRLRFDNRILPLVKLVAASAKRCAAK